MVPYYRKHGKIAYPITEEAFKKGMKGGHFCKPKHKAFCVLLYYSAVRKMEALRSLREQYQLTDSGLYFEVGERLKKQKSWFRKTPPLFLSWDNPFMEELEKAVKDTKKEKRVFPYCSKTGYNIVSRVWKYPHLFRLSRITWFFDEGYNIAQVRSWTGLTLQALEYYVGIVDIKRMGEKLT